MKKLLLGMDGGGTKTLTQVADGTGAALFRIQSGALNLNGESPEAVRAVVQSVVREALDRAGSDSALAAVCIGAAGVSNPATESTLRTALTDAGFTGPVLITGDHMTALAGALGSPEGMLLISGTGSICVGCTPDGREVRAGGRGHLIDDEGSGYAMGRDILRMVVEAEDGRHAPTRLTAAVYEALHISSIEELVAFVYTPGRPKKEIAALARLLPSLAEDGAAKEIYSHAARALAKLAETVASRMGVTEGVLALAGSALQNDRALREGLERCLSQTTPGLRCILPKNDAATGAVLLAGKLLQKSGGIF